MAKIHIIFHNMSILHEVSIKETYLLLFETHTLLVHKFCHRTGTSYNSLVYGIIGKRS